MSKIIFFDLDRTTCDDHMNVPESTIKAISELHDNGHLAFICTGRARANVADERIEEIGFDGVVAACGNHIEFNGKVLYENILSEKLVDKALKLFKNNNLPVIIEGPHYHWFDSKGFSQEKFVKMLKDEMGDKAKEMDDFSTDEKVNKFTVNILPQSDVDTVVKELDDDLDFIVHYNKAIEFIPKGSSKATGIERVCNIFNIDHEDVYAIGDGPNDIDMLNYVKHSIVMGNGTDDAKAAAEYVTTDIHDNGVYNAMKHYALI